MNWWRIEVLCEAGTEAEWDALFDAVADAAHDHEPAGIDVHVSGCTNIEQPEWAR